MSEKHANFIVNPEGKASASAIEMLIGQIGSVVREKFGVTLVPEVRIVGEIRGVSGAQDVVQEKAEE